MAAVLKQPISHPSSETGVSCVVLTTTVLSVSEWDCSLRRVTWYLSVSVKLVKTNTKSFISKLDHSDLIVTHTCRNAVFCRCCALAAVNLVWVLIPSTQAETVSTVSFNHYQQLMATVSAFPLSSLNHDCVCRSVTKKTGGKTEAVKISLEGGWDQKWTHKRVEARVERLGDKGWDGHVCMCKRRWSGHTEQRMLRMELAGWRKRGRP